jgi:Protein of unknown function (DUF3175)
VPSTMRQKQQKPQRPKRQPPAGARAAAKRRGGRPTGRVRPGEPARRWSQGVTRTSDALDLEPKVFAQDDPHQIALSLKRSAERSRRRKSEPFRSAMSMLTFYLNRAGKNLPERRRAVLEQAKSELRKVFQKPQRRSG